MLQISSHILYSQVQPPHYVSRAVIPTCETLAENLQRQENRVWRYLLDIGGYSTIESLRGEIGASMVRTRIMETMLLYVLDTLNGKFQDVKRLMLHTISSQKGRWYKAANSYREELEITWEELENLDRANLKKMIKKYDTEKWKQGLIQKTSLRYYIQGKKDIGYEFCYRNNKNSTFLARARTNSLKLEEHKGRGVPGYDRTCKLCMKEEENLVHFIVDCEELEDVRNYKLINRSQETSEDRMITLLFYNDNQQDIGYMIKKLWEKRRNLMKYKEKEEERRRKEHDSLAQQKGNYKSDPGPLKGGCVYPRQRYRNIPVGSY